MLRVIAFALLGLTGCITSPYELEVSWQLSGVASRFDLMVRVWHPGGVVDSAAGVGTIVIDGDTTSSDVDVCAQAGYMEGSHMHPLSAKACTSVVPSDYHVDLYLSGD